MNHVHSAVPIAHTALGSRAENSLTPSTLYDDMMHQYSSTGLCARSLALNVGTTQSPRSSISRAQPAFRGSSRSHSRGPPRFVSMTMAVTMTTVAACLILGASKRSSLIDWKPDA